MIERFWNIDKQSPSNDLLSLLKLAGLPSPPPTLPELAKKVQETFLRPPGKERWELQDSLRYRWHKKKILRHLYPLGLLEPIQPLFPSYQSLLILWTSAEDLIGRILFALSLDIEVKAIYLLSGERTLRPRERQTLRNYQNREIPETEDEMLPFLFHRLAPKELKTIPIVSKKKKDGSRPTTQDTIRDWLAIKPHPGRHLLISSQPFGYYQLLTSKSALKSTHNTTITLDMAAAPPSKDLFSISLCLDTIARILYELSDL